MCECKKMTNITTVIAHCQIICAMLAAYIWLTYVSQITVFILDHYYCIVQYLFGILHWNFIIDDLCVCSLDRIAFDFQVKSVLQILYLYWKHNRESVLQILYLYRKHNKESVLQILYLYRKHNKASVLQILFCVSLNCVFTLCGEGCIVFLYFCYYIDCSTLHW